MLGFYLLVQGHYSGFAINYFTDRKKTHWHFAFDTVYSPEGT